MLKHNLKKTLVTICLLVGTSATGGAAVLSMNMLMENASLARGAYVTPVWMGLEDQTFDLIQTGVDASKALEMLLAENGVATVGPTDAGSESRQNSAGFATGPYYVSYIGTLVPQGKPSGGGSASGGGNNTKASEIFTPGGLPLGANPSVPGSTVSEGEKQANSGAAGPANTVSSGQAVVPAGPSGSAATTSTGATASGAVASQPELRQEGSGSILDDPTLANLDAGGVSIMENPEPSTAAMALLGLAVVAAVRRKRKA